MRVVRNQIKRGMSFSFHWAPSRALSVLPVVTPIAAAAAVGKLGFLAMQKIICVRDTGTRYVRRLAHLGRISLLCIIFECGTWIAAGAGILRE